MHMFMYQRVKVNQTYRYNLHIHMVVTVQQMTYLMGIEIEPCPWPSSLPQRMTRDTNQMSFDTSGPPRNWMKLSTDKCFI